MGKKVNSHRMTAKGVRVGKDQPIRTCTAQHARQRIVGQQAGIDCDAATKMRFSSSRITKMLVAEHLLQMHTRFRCGMTVSTGGL
jgi:hypothetical protein